MRILGSVSLSCALVATSLALAAPAAAADPVRTVTVTGTDSLGQPLSTYPGYEETTERFAVRSPGDLDAVSLTASSTDPGASVVVNGQPVRNGAAARVTGVEPGDEINVQITDAGGTTNQSWIVTPPGFPALSASGPSAGQAEGHVFLGLSSFIGSPYTAIVDAHGVPVRATAGGSNDFKRSDGNPEHYSIALAAEDGGYRIAELDGQFREVRSRQLAAFPASSTDFHDAVLLPDGGAVLMGYDPANRGGSNYVDSVIEVQDPDGTPTFTWNSKDHVDEDAEGLVDRSAYDYAHINSLQRLDNGDLIASFRNLSQVMRIAGSDHGTWQAGDVMWRLGGLENDFDFVDDPYSGPCAQHAATILGNGHLLIFDNGARRDESGPIAPQTADMCPQQGAPATERVARPQSRVTEYALDLSGPTPTATLVWHHTPEGRYAPFAGNAQRLPNGNTMVGWSRAEADSSEPASGQGPMATEVTAGGDEVWSLSASGYFTYRAFKHVADDEIAPTIDITSPADGASVEAGSPLVARFSCSDTGGSNLAGCTGSVPAGTSLSSQVGTHTFEVVATDRAGNRTTRTVTYTVTPATTVGQPPAAIEPARADLHIRKPGKRWVGKDVYRAGKQTVTFRTSRARKVTAKVRVRNSGETRARMRLDGARSNRWSQVRWFAGKRDVTRRVVAGTYRTKRLAPGRSVRLRVVVRVRRTDADRSRTVRLKALAAGAGTGRDVVRARLVVRGR